MNCMERIQSNPNKITPCLWLIKDGEAAARFYVSVFRNSAIGRITYYGKDAPMPEGEVMAVEFKIEGQPFLIINGGDNLYFSEAISFSINCDNQEEIDYYWDKLKAPDTKGQCGWLKDKFGLSWQIVPTKLKEWLTSGPEKASRVMQEVMKMEKLDIDRLQAAYDSV